MTITRHSLFGVPAGINQGSQQTERAVPLSQGMKANEAWAVSGPGSAASMRNFLPLDGVLRPRSRLSKLRDTVAPPSGGGVYGLTELYGTSAAAPIMYWSSITAHGIMGSTGSWSQGSYVSAFGFGGVNDLTNQLQWSFTQVYSANLDRNMVIAAGIDSNMTLMCIYQQGANALPNFSFLTSAPRGRAVCSFDNYLLAWNVGPTLVSRVQWNVRGLPSNWTGEGSGYEDLLAMRGAGTMIWPTADQRVLLFTDLEIWYGVTATYPAQFLFQPLDPAVGCPHGKTVQDCPEGVLFLGNDLHVRLLPRGGGLSQIVAPSLQPALRRLVRQLDTTSRSFGVYDRMTGLYHLFINTNNDIALEVGVVLNTRTGEWGWEEYSGTGEAAPQAGFTMSPAYNQYTGNEGLMFGNVNGKIYSTTSVLAGSETPVSTWRSPPLATDLPGNWKQLSEVNLDYRATSLSTVTLKVSQDGGNVFETTGRSVALSTAANAGRAAAQVYIGGALPTIELTSQSTGFELHRLDISLLLGGRRSA